MQHFRSIHYLRGVAAIMVVIFHSFSNVPFMKPELASAMWLRGGVDIFFVISGFVMMQATSGKTITTPIFLTQRAIRIVPMYWIATFAVMMQIDGEWLFKLKSLLFFPAIHPETATLQPVLKPGWTLNYEMFFYVIFAATLLVNEKWRIAAVAGIFGLLVSVAPMFEGGSVMQFYGRPIMFEFIFGMVIAKFGIRLPLIAVPLGVCAMVLLDPLAINRVVSLGIPAAFIVGGALGYESRLPASKMAALLGSASYSIYLFHLITLGIIVRIWPGAEADKMAFIAISSAMMVVTGCGIYWALERPLIFWLSQAQKQFSFANRQAGKAA